MIKSCSASNIPMVVDAGPAGTVMRFLTAFLTQCSGKWLLLGSRRMQQRPMKTLVDALQLLNADIKSLNKDQRPPLLLIGTELTGDIIRLDATVSSQFISALMLIAPTIKKGLTLQFNSRPVSASYINMTAKLMEEMGAKIRMSKHEIHVSEGNYTLHPMAVEADWSSAAFWYEIVAMGKKMDIFLPDLHKKSLQGDRALAEVFTHFGVQTNFENNGIRLQKKRATGELLDYDYSACPDIVPSVMATCASLGIHGIFRGIEHLRFKESDRIEKLKKELGKMGATLTKQDASYLLTPGKPEHSTLLFETHNDHRLAMCLAPLALLYPNVFIADPDVVVKSYPTYWEELAKTGILKIEEMDMDSHEFLNLYHD